MTVREGGASHGRLERENAPALAWARLAGAAPEIVFLTVFRSDMTGTKALFLEEHCRRRGRAFTRFDYRGHGQSAGSFEEGTIGAWTEDAIAVLDRVVDRLSDGDLTDANDTPDGSDGHVRRRRR